MGVCRVNPCDRDEYAKNLCEKHYRRRLRTGFTSGRVLAGEACAVEGCGHPVDARDLCHGHYQRLLRGTEVDSPLQQTGRICSVPDCGRPHKAMGYCQPHYKRVLATGTLGPTSRFDRQSVKAR